MDIQQRLLSLKEKQQNIVSEYESLVKDYDATGIIRQNETLKRQLAGATEEVTRLHVRYKKAAEEIQNLKISLKVQIFDEKFNIVKISQSKMDTYFKNTAVEAENRLTALEAHYNAKIVKLKSDAHKNLADDQKEFTAELEQAAQRLGKGFAFTGRKSPRGRKRSPLELRRILTV